jgi:hypothetical protein
MTRETRDLCAAWTRETNMPAKCAGIGIGLEAEAALDPPLGNRAHLDAGLILPKAPEYP